MTESMIERVARAICLGDPDALSGRIKSEKTDSKLIRVWTDDTDLIPAWQQSSNVENAKRAIKAMIDKALEDA